jgi:hypothetical protein
VRARAAELRADRTWASVLHPLESLTHLADSLQRQSR